MLPINNVIRRVLIFSACSIFLIVSCVFASSAFAEDEESLLVDVNGDTIVSYLGFGDSLTFGIGDEFDAGGGYVARLGVLLGIPVTNKGVPGEEISTTGELRFVRSVQSSVSDIVGLLEGANDAFNEVSSRDVSRAQQKVINVSNVLGRTLILLTLPRPCCEHARLVPFVASYNDSIKELAAINDLRVADIEHAWKTTCADQSECELYNLPAGLHPNGRGYDVIAQTVAASLLGIDIFLPDGPAQLESALGLAPGTVIVKPDLMSTTMDVVEVNS